jgi:hypothetical protein
VEHLQARGSGGSDRVQHGLEVVDEHRLGVRHRPDGAVDPEHRGPPLFEVDVGRAELNGTPQEGVEVHAAVVGRQWAALERG